MERITITAGTAEDRTGAAIAPETLAQALATIRGTLARMFGGYTEADTYGGWIADDGRLVTEPGKRWTILAGPAADAAESNANAAAEVVRVALNQSAVVLEVETVRAEFVTAEVKEAV